MKLLKNGARQRIVTPSSRLEAALSYAARGWHVFPCWWVQDGMCACGRDECKRDQRKRGKHPLTENGSLDATTDRRQITAWWTHRPHANIGIATGPSGLVVLDVDPRNGGDASLQVLNPATVDLDTYSVRTGRRGGRHHYYECADPLRTRKGLLPGIDVLASTGYVIAAGSAGVEHDYECLRDAPLKPVPAWLLDAMQRPRSPEPQAERENWVAAVLAGVDEGQRNDTGTKLAGYFIGEGIPVEITRQILHLYGARCVPPMQDAEVDRTVKSIAEREASKVGPLVVVGESLPSFAERMKAQPARRVLIENLILDGSITLLHGQPRAGKTLAMLEMLMALATGTPAFGLDSLGVSVAIPVLYVTEEDPAIRVWERLDKMCRGRGLSPVPALFTISAQHGLSIDNLQDRASIIDTVKRGGIRAVAFEPLRSLTARADQGPAELAPVVAFLRELQRETGVAILLGHHDTKPTRTGDIREAPQRVSGGGLFAVADSPISVSRQSSAPFTSLLQPSHFKFDADPQPFSYVLQEDDDGGWRLVGSTKAEDEAVAAHQDDAAVLRFVTEHPGQSGNAVIKGVRRKRDRVLGCLRRLEARGEIESTPNGRGRSWRAVLPSSTDGSTGSAGSTTVPEPPPSVGSTVPLPKGREPRTDPGTDGKRTDGHRPASDQRWDNAT